MDERIKLEECMAPGNDMMLNGIDVCCNDIKRYQITNTDENRMVFIVGIMSVLGLRWDVIFFSYVDIAD